MIILGVVLLLLGLLLPMPYPLNTLLIVGGIIAIVVGLFLWFRPVGPGVVRRRYY